jgi:hypothetical protein
MLDMTIPQYGYIILMAKMDKDGEFPQLSKFPKSSIACICGTVCGTADMGARCGDAICGEPGAGAICGACGACITGGT